VALFDVNHGLRREEDTITIELSNIPNQRMGRHENELLSRFFGKKRKFQLPKYDPNQVNGYLLNLDEIENWHSGFNVAVKINLKKWQKNDSIYLAFSQYTKVEPYHCNTGVEVECDQDFSDFARCFPQSMLPLFLENYPFCEFRPLSTS